MCINCYNTCKTLEAGIAWATPVEPDELVAHLAAYTKVLPIIRTLRLAQRFGQGPRAYITKLPLEIEQAVEGLIIRSECKYQSFECSSAFACFQGICAPSSHFADFAETHGLWDIVDGKSLDKCGACVEHGRWDAACEKRCSNTSTLCDPCRVGLGSADCGRTCRARYDEEVENVARRSRYSFDMHWQQGIAWSAGISQAKKGAFHKYDVIMRKHFGLEVYFADTTVDERKADRWPKHKNDRWNSADERKTTLCYLTLPERFGPLSSFCPSDMAAELGGPEIKAAQAIDIDMDALTITDEQRRRFHRALKTLGIEPYLHPSQAHRVTVSANVSQEQPKAKTEKGMGGEGETEKRASSDWPRLLLLVKSM